MRARSAAAPASRAKRSDAWQVHSGHRGRSWRLRALGAALAWALALAPGLVAGELEVDNQSYTGDFGLRVGITDLDPAYVQDDSPFGDRAYHVRFYVRSTELSMGAAEDLDLFVGYACSGAGPQVPTQAHVRVVLREGGAQGLQAVVAVRENTGFWVETPAVDLPAGWRAIEMHWQAATSGQSNGTLDWWLDGNSQNGLLGVANDQAAIDCVRWGAVDSIGAGTVGPESALNLDDFESRREDYIGLLSVFSDVTPEHPFWPFVQAVYNFEVTAGCGGGQYCEGDSVTRAQMAVFLLRSLEGPTYVPPPCTSPPFADVPVEVPSCRWIQELAAREITAGCSTSPPLYCPNAPVTREQMAVFLLSTRDGATPLPPCTTSPFEDVPIESGFCPWISKLVDEGITAGCGVSPPLYCPNDPNTRGQMAVFLSATFQLLVPVPNP